MCMQRITFCDDFIFHLHACFSQLQEKTIKFYVFYLANYGFNIKGGLDRPVLREDTGIFVTQIRPKGVAAKHGGLAPGDRILEVGM